MKFVRRASAVAAGSLVIAALAAHGVGASVTWSKRDADSFARKLDTINVNSLRSSRAPRVTPVREAEVNAYLRYYVADQLPTGVSEPIITILGDGRLAGRAMVDLDSIRREQATDEWLDPKGYLTGRLPISAVGTLHTKAGTGRLEIEAVEVAGIPVPLTVLERLVGYYSRNADNPEGFDLGSPFELPAGVVEVRVRKGEADIVQ